MYNVASRSSFSETDINYNVFLGVSRGQETLPVCPAALDVIFTSVAACNRRTTSRPHLSKACALRRLQVIR